VPDPAVTLRQMVLPRSALKNELLPVGAPGGESTAVENHHSQSHLFAERSESVLGLESSTQRRCVPCSDPFAACSQVDGRDLQRSGHWGCTLLEDSRAALNAPLFFMTLVGSQIWLIWILDDVMMLKLKLVAGSGESECAPPTSRGRGAARGTNVASGGASRGSFL
jgi:hypothetical protein